MLHKAWNSKGEMPYRFPRSSVKFQGHTVQNITDFDPNRAFPDYRPVAAFKSLRFALFHWNSNLTESKLVITHFVAAVLQYMAHPLATWQLGIPKSVWQVMCCICHLEELKMKYLLNFTCKWKILCSSCDNWIISVIFIMCIDIWIFPLKKSKM